MAKTSRDAVPRSSGERGAALITTLMLSTLLLSLGGTLIVETMLQSTNTVAVTSEMQTYYAAEAGLEAALNAIRGNVQPSSAYSTPPGMNFGNAASLSTSNLPSDNAVTFKNARLSGWLNYNGNNGYSVLIDPQNPNVSFSVTVCDPDNPAGPCLPYNTPPVGASAQPTRLEVTSTGYGPNGSIKVMEMMVARSNFRYNPSSVVLMNGATPASPASSTATITFDAGSSGAKNLSGLDNAGTGKDLPFVGVTNPVDLPVPTGLDKGKTTPNTPDANITATLPSTLPLWLQTPAAARTTLAQLKSIAIGQGRYFGTGPASTVNWSSILGGTGTATAPLLTFVDGSTDVGTGFVGAGLLIVTGTLSAHGNTSFDGLILGLGAGSMDRSGGGNGTILGAMVFANFSATAPTSGPDNFLPSSFSTSGGGDGSIFFDSSWVTKAINTIVPQAIGVSEQ